MTLLISGGAGAVAHYAIQFAKARGATVITTVQLGREGEGRARGGRRSHDRLQARAVGERVMAITGGAASTRDRARFRRECALLPDVLRPPARS